MAELTSAAAPTGAATDAIAETRFARARRVVVDAWNRFFFSEEPVVGAVAFRWWFAVWTFAYFLPRVPYAEELWARPVLRQTAKQWKWIGDPMMPVWTLYLALAVLFILLVLFAIGWHARVMHVLLVVPFYFLMMQDTVMPRAYGSIASWQWILFFFVAYDRLRDDDGSIAMRPRWGLRIVQLLFASIYFFAVFAKLVDGAGWATGRAIHNSMASERYGNFLLSNLPLPDWLAFIYSWTTLGLEFTIPILLFFRRTQPYAILMSITLHVIMATSLRVSAHFHILMIGHLLLFVPATFWKHWFPGIETTPRPPR